MEVEPHLKMLCIFRVPQAMDIVQHHFVLLQNTWGQYRSPVVCYVSQFSTAARGWST